MNTLPRTTPELPPSREQYPTEQLELLNTRNALSAPPKIPVRLPFNQPTMDQLQLLHAHNIPYGIYSGGHVAYLIGTRPIGDVDVMIRKQDYIQTYQLLGGRPYNFEPLFYSPQTPKKRVFFIATGDMEIKAGSDGEPGYFTFTQLVEDNCITVDEGGHRMTFVSPTETFLFKVALWREKDQADVHALLDTGLINPTYLHERLHQTGIARRIHPRLIKLLGSYRLNKSIIL